MSDGLVASDSARIDARSRGGVAAAGAAHSVPVSDQREKLPISKVSRKITPTPE